MFRFFIASFALCAGFLIALQAFASSHSATITNPAAGTWQAGDFQVRYNALNVATCRLETKDGTGAWTDRGPISCGADKSATIQVGASGWCSTQGQDECRVRIRGTPPATSTPFDSVGTESWVVPPSVTEIEVELWGAQGHFNNNPVVDGGTIPGGGKGGYLKTHLKVTPGESLSFFIGGAGTYQAGGFHGGGGSDSHGGGGASEIRDSGGNTLAIAGGGGGSGATTYSTSPGFWARGGQGGNGGDLIAQTGAAGWPGKDGSPPGGGGGEGDSITSTGGTAGSPSPPPPPTPGSLGQGGDGGGPSSFVFFFHSGPGGGGGGGYYGGGGGGGSTANTGNPWGSGAGGGGGGSSWTTNNPFRFLGPTTHAQGIQEGSGRIVITHASDLPAQDERVFSIDYTKPVASFDIPPTPPDGTDQTSDFAVQYDTSDNVQLANCVLSSSSDGGGTWTSRKTGLAACGIDQTDAAELPGWCVPGARCAIRIWAQDVAGNTGEQTLSFNSAFTGGLVPCGRETNDPKTDWDESKPCELSHAFLLIWILVNFALWKMAPLIIALLVVATGAILFFQFGGPEVLTQVRGIWRAVIIGALVLLFSWLFLNFFLGILGFDINTFGQWYEIAP